ncbi:MAG TPA: hypothetical protein VET85_03550 [Stellaceae bacterium]|nr:hypothetical protein [Stellaceae bacterium]
MRPISLMVGALVALLAVPAFAQMPEGTLTNVRGKVEKLDGQTLVVKARDGKTVTVTLADKFGVLGIVKSSLTDIKPGQFIGTAALTQKDGKLHAQEVLIFPPGVRPGEGHYPWDLKGKEDTMTNADVVELDSVANGKAVLLKLKHKDGANEVVVDSRTPVVTFAPDSPALLTKGTTIFIRALKKPDGTIVAQNVVAEKNGVKPPM